MNVTIAGGGGESQNVFLKPEDARVMAEALMYAADCLDGLVSSWEEWEAKK